ncbi:hypothetical protein MHF_0333 [Mycoplasma haemofelis Ohio2]|uniref:Uncharacterized protein n=1 Tax=Mycoplasma haemofelis (strain Ohio2) TaxID=859194 RepID=F6FGT9_MYCHI|nr:hypothetical protein MHF_0333 [Mycoplasma haemofelis Ohio2]
MDVALLGKAIVGLMAGATATAGAVYFGTDLFKEEISKRTISSLLREKNPERRLLTSSIETSDQAWKDAWAQYRNKNKESNPWGLKNLSKITQDVPPDDFVSKCSFKSGLEISDDSDPLYREVLSYCTRDTLVSDLIVENNRTLLTSTSPSEDWQKAWEVYRTNNADKTQGKDAWQLTEWDSKKNGNTHTSDYQTKCAEKAKVKAFDLNSEVYKRVLAWCTKD